MFADRGRRGPRRRELTLPAWVLSVVAGIVACAGSGLPTVDREAPATRLRVLQSNLCDSGEARCYTGRSVVRLSEVIRAEEPEVVTLNEICEDDVAVLGQALAGIAAHDVVVTAFQAAKDRRSDTDYRCRRNGRRFGIAVLARTPAAGGPHTTRGGVYPIQDLADPEERVWVCLDLPARFTACTTHLANTVPAVAIGQCRALMATVFPNGEAGDLARTRLVAGDLNLRPGRPPDVRPCRPDGIFSADDTDVQHVVADVAVESSRTIDMLGTTDHPALLVVLTPAPG